MNFQLRVIDQANSPHVIKLEADSELLVRIEAEKKGFTVLSIKSVGNRSLRRKFPILLFCQELAVLLQSGLLLTQALDTLSQKEKHPETKAVLDKLLASLRDGSAFSNALKAQPNEFPALFVAMIRACETTGNLAEGILRFAHYLEQIDVLKKRLISASIYPSVILSFGFLVMLFLLGFVVPRFSHIYASRDTHLSAASEALLYVGSIVNAYGPYLLIGLVSLVSLLTFVLTRASVRKFIGETLMRIPAIGDRIRIYHLTRFYRTFAMLLRSGIPVVSALSMVSGLLGVTLKAHVDFARAMILDGGTFSQAMQRSELVTPVASELFKVGEQAGNLDKMMERAAEFHEEEMLRWVDTFSKLVEPILMALLGVIIGGIVFLMYMPIFELANAIQS